MGCVYNLRGHLFNSELELDNFLLDKGKYLEQFGDEVFSRSAANLLTTALIKNKLKTRTDSKYDYALGTDEDTFNGYSDIEPAVKLGKDLHGVTSFLQGLKQQNGQLFFPEFRLESYWEGPEGNTGRRAAWANYTPENNTYTDEELEAFFDDPKNPHAIITEDEYKRCRDIMENKWQIQAQVGTEIHNVLEQLFANEQQLTYNTNDLFTKFRDRFDSELIPDKALRDAITRAKEIRLYAIDKFGSKGDLTFMPEVVIKGETSHINEVTGKPDTIVGIIDLLIIDGDGNIHIVDYKTSPKSYGAYDDVKITTFMFQMETYRRLLQRKLGINVDKTDVIVIPLKLNNFKKQDDDTWTYDGIANFKESTDMGKKISKGISESVGISLNLAMLANRSLSDCMDEYLPYKPNVEATSENMLLSVTETMSRWLPQYGSSKQHTLEYAQKLAEARVKRRPNAAGKYTYRFPGTSIEVEGVDAASLALNIQKQLEKSANYNERLTKSITLGLEEAINTGDVHYNFEGVSDWGHEEKAIQDWFNNYIAKYCDGNWFVVGTDLDNTVQLNKKVTKQLNGIEAIQQFGGILLKNKTTGVLNFIKISSHDLYQNLNLAKGKGLTGAFENDLTAQNKPNSQIMEGIAGNAELMEAMLILNHIKGIYDLSSYVGEIVVLNPRMLKGITAGNELLMYNFRELSKLSPIQGVENNITNGEIKLGSRVLLFKSKFLEIMTRSEHMSESSWKNWAKVKGSLTSNFDADLNDLYECGKALNKFRQLMIEAFPELSHYNPKAHVDYTKPEWQLFTLVTQAIADYDGAKFYQQVREHDKWVDGLLTRIAINGVQGLRTDNPGSLNSPLLNLATQMVVVAYLNVRSDMEKHKAKIRELVANLKADKLFGYFKQHTFGNSIELYENMFLEGFNSEDTDIIMKNPWKDSSMSTAEKEFLKYFLIRINQNRGDLVNMTDDLIANRLSKSDSILYFRCPLTRGDSNSKFAVEGLLETFKLKCKDLSPKNVVQRAQEKIDGIMSEDDRKTIAAGQQWEMINGFDRGEDVVKRQQWIEDQGIGVFEHDLENLLLKHIFAKSQKDNLDQVFPTLQAMALHLVTLGSMINHELTEDISYLMDYIKNKIFNLSIKSENELLASAYLNKIMRLTSIIALGLSPTQVYQYLDGIWKDVSLSIRKPDGSAAFTVSNLRDSYFNTVYENSLHFGDTKTKTELINELFGINDMDMNQWVDRIKSNLYSFWNYDAFLFRFASRPDFYNRMTMFLAHMRADGCWEAHYVENGKLIYDWTKDTRFDVFAKYGYKENQVPSNLKLKYLEQKQLYLVMANQLVAEHTKNDDGTLFKITKDKPMALPKAYTTRQSESYKDEADLMYGYYSHEKKSLLQASFVGGLFLQMYTYWSGKKNQYLQSSGIKSRGKFEQYKALNSETGKMERYYHKINPDGTVSEEITTENTGIPCIVWQGLFLEGIVLTVMNGLKIMLDEKSFDAAKYKIWDNEDENLRRAYRSNLKQLIYDMVMFTVVGKAMAGMLAGQMNEYKKTHPNTELGNAINNTLFSLGDKALRQSADDLNPITSIMGRFVDTNFFSFSMMERMAENYGKVISGDRRFYDATINTFTATRATRPIWEFVNPKEETKK